MFMKVNTKMDCLMVEDYFIIMFNSMLTKKVNTISMGILSRGKNMVLVKKVTSQEESMKDSSSIIKSMEMGN